MSGTTCCCDIIGQVVVSCQITSLGMALLSHLPQSSVVSHQQCKHGVFIPSLTDNKPAETKTDERNVDDVITAQVVHDLADTEVGLKLFIHYLFIIIVIIYFIIHHNYLQFIIHHVIVCYHSKCFYDEKKIVGSEFNTVYDFIFCSECKPSGVVFSCCCFLRSLCFT